MSRLCFDGKVALLGERGYAELLVDEPFENQGFIVANGRAITPQSTFIRYYDRDKPDEWYLVAANGKYLVRGGGVQFWFYLAAASPHPAQSFYLRPDSGDEVRLVHVATEQNVGVESTVVHHTLVVDRGSTPPRPVSFSIITLTKGYDEVVATAGGWTDADLSGVDFTGMPDLLPNIKSWSGANLRGAKFSGMDLRNVKLDSKSILPEAKLTGTTLDGLDFTEANLDGADVTSASVQRVKLTSASMVGTDFTSANLTGATFSAQSKFSTDPAKRTLFVKATLDDRALMDWSYLDMSEANIQPQRGDLSGLRAQQALFNRINLIGFTMHGVQLNHCDLSDARLDSATVTEATLDSCNLTGATMDHADLSKSSLKGALLHKASLASARLVGANCTGAQLGATEALFALPGQQKALLARGELSAELREGFAAHGVALAESNPLQITERDPERTWLLTSGEERYRLSLDASGAMQVRRYLGLDQAAVLSGAYMPDAIFTDADLYAVNMAGAHWYGAGARADNANLEQIDGSNGNFGQLNLAQAELRGATFSNATLANANLRGAHLGPSASGKQCSLAQATLVGADCTAADLSNAVLHNAAISIAAQAGGASVNGVPLFPMLPALAADLDAARLSAEVKNACAASGYPLADDASINVRQAGTHWEIRNGSGDGAQVGRGYATLAILRQTDALHVYGSAIWITRIGAGGELETIQFSYAATALSERELSAQTVCPNGKTLQASQGSGLTWEQMVTADKPPTPPACIPSPDHWCRV